AGDAGSPPPRPLDAAILFAPAGDLIPPILDALDRAGTLAVAGIHVTEPGSLDYQRHLFNEKTLTTVTANTRRDGDEFFELAGRLELKIETRPFAMEDADQALTALATGRLGGVAVLRT
ncbi:MAG TPA: hypothetical protein VM754_03895, partial [Actinomycetota bacterium]|nr:hypothetical protein [Actinomycetota bacterium]